MANIDAFIAPSNNITSARPILWYAWNMMKNSCKMQINGPK